MGTYDVNDTRRLTVTSKDIDDALADPTTLTFKMREPDGTVTTYVFGADAEVVKSSTGVFYVDWAITQPGKHRYRWIGTGTVAAAEEDEFNAREDSVS